VHAHTIGDLMSSVTSVAIIGAGPYGLSLAAHLRARNVDFRIFGQCMQSWRTQMPQGMLLKSEGDASNLYDPGGTFTLKNFCQERGIAYRDSGLPVRLDTFCDYGLAFQQRFVPELEERLVSRLASAPEGFALQLDDGQSLLARRVVVAVGVGYYPHVPRVLRPLPPEQVSHASRYGDLSGFAGRDVIVVGGGASALDIAALLHGCGARIRLVARAPSLDIHLPPSDRPRPLWQRIRHPRTGIGNSLRSWFLVKAPLAFHCLPEGVRLRVTQRHLGPAGGWFVREQLEGKVSMLLGYTLQRAEADQGRVRLLLVSRSGQPLEVVTEHVIAATGYRVDLRRLPFLDPALQGGVRAVGHTPLLSSRFESSIAGLYFIGPTAANSFGSVMRFAYGAGFTARHLSAHLQRMVRVRPAADAGALHLKGAS
jgi:cation diffusion facilitator CzcD-associated flavoprotein CzcO